MNFIKVNNRYEKSIEYEVNTNFNSKLFGLQKEVGKRPGHIKPIKNRRSISVDQKK